VKTFIENKTYYKLLLLLLKYLPGIIALCYIFNTLSALFGKHYPYLNHIIGLSILPWVFMYISACVFKFCIYHKILLWYILFEDILGIIDYNIGFSSHNLNVILVHFLCVGILMFFILYIHVKNNKKRVT
jgi:hypothetical protein